MNYEELEVRGQRGFTEHLELYFETEGRFSNEEIMIILENIRIAVEQNPKIGKLTIMRS